MTVTFEQAKVLLADCTRTELRDHAFGDREIYWENAAGEAVAEGYAGGAGYQVGIGTSSFDGAEAQELVNLGTIGDIEHNDSTGPDDYEDGKTMPGLTDAGVLKELTGY